MTVIRLQKVRFINHILTIMANKRLDASLGETEVVGIAPSTGDAASAALRLRLGEGGSCLWLLRCGDIGLRAAIKRILDGEAS